MASLPQAVHPACTNEKNSNSRISPRAATSDSSPFCEEWPEHTTLGVLFSNSAARMSVLPEPSCLADTLATGVEGYRGLQHRKLLQVIDSMMKPYNPLYTLSECTLEPPT